MLLPPWAGLEGGHATSPPGQGCGRDGNRLRQRPPGLGVGHGGRSPCPEGASHPRAGVPFGGAIRATLGHSSFYREQTSPYHLGPKRGRHSGRAHLSLEEKVRKLLGARCATEGSSPDPSSPSPPPSRWGHLPWQPPPTQALPACTPTPTHSPGPLPPGAARETPPNSHWQLPQAEATLRGLLPHQATPPTHLEVKAQGTWGSLWSGRVSALGGGSETPDWRERREVTALPTWEPEDPAG